MTKRNHPEITVAGIVAPAARSTIFALFLIASAVSMVVAIPLWLVELLL